MKTFRESFDAVPQQQYDKTADARSYKDSFQGDIDFDTDFLIIAPEKVDESLFRWFNSQYPIYIRQGDDQPKKTKVIFSVNERWALVRLQKDVRDATGQIILPIISIKRQEMTAIQERTVAVDKDGTANLEVYVHEKINPDTRSKEYVASTIKSDIYPVIEIIEVQPPKMTSFTYVVTFWSNYMQDVNDANAHMLIKFGKHHSVYYDQNLFFRASLESISNNSNDENVGADQRIFKSAFQITIEAPLIGEDNIIRHKTIQGLDTQVIISDEALPAKLSDKIRSRIDWHDLKHMYRLRR